MAINAKKRFGRFVRDRRTAKELNLRKFAELVSDKPDVPTERGGKEGRKGVRRKGRKGVIAESYPERKGAVAESYPRDANTTTRMAAKGRRAKRNRP